MNDFSSEVNAYFARSWGNIYRKSKIYEISTVEVYISSSRIGDIYTWIYTVCRSRLIWHSRIYNRQRKARVYNFSRVHIDDFGFAISEAKYINYFKYDCCISFRETNINPSRSKSFSFSFYCLFEFCFTIRDNPKFFYIPISSPRSFYDFLSCSIAVSDIYSTNR